MAHRLDHFDGNNSVKLANQIAVVFFYNGYSVLEPVFLNPVLSIFKLTVRNCGGGYLGLGSLGEPVCESTPSSPDFKNMVVGLNVKLINNPVVFCQ